MKWATRGRRGLGLNMTGMQRRIVFRFLAIQKVINSSLPVGAIALEDCY